MERMEIETSRTESQRRSGVETPGSSDGGSPRFFNSKGHSHGPRHKRPSVAYLAPRRPLQSEVAMQQVFVRKVMAILATQQVCNVFVSIAMIEFHPQWLKHRELQNDGMKLTARLLLGAGTTSFLVSLIAAARADPVRHEEHRCANCCRRKPRRSVNFCFLVIITFSNAIVNGVLCAAREWNQHMADAFSVFVVVCAGILVPVGFVGLIFNIERRFPMWSYWWVMAVGVVGTLLLVFLLGTNQAYDQAKRWHVFGGVMAVLYSLFAIRTTQRNSDGRRCCDVGIRFDYDDHDLGALVFYYDLLDLFLCFLPSILQK